MNKRQKKKLIDGLMAAAGIAIILAIFGLAVMFAPEGDTFSDSEFVQDVGRRYSY